MTWSPVFTDVTPGPTSTHDAGAFMTEDRRKQALRIGAGKGEVVGVADAGRLDLNQHLAGLRAVELDGHDFERLARLHGDCGANVHSDPYTVYRLHRQDRNKIVRYASEPTGPYFKSFAVKAEWSGRRESNPRMKLGKLPFYH